MTFLGFSGLVNFITCFSIAVFVVVRNIRNPLNISFFNLNVSVALYSFGYFFWQLAKNEYQALFWFKILTVGIILINITYLYFVFHFLGLIDRKRTLLRICTIINFFFIILNLSSNFYTHLELRYNLGFWPVPTTFFHLYLTFWFWQCFYGFYWLLKSLKLYSGIKRQQIKYFTISAILGFAGGATNWPMWYKIHLPPYLNIAISIYIGIVAYAIFRYRLMDINVALTRAGIFTVVYTLVLGIPFWIGHVTKAWFPATLFAVTLATLGPFIYQYLRHRAEDRLLKDQRRYQKALRELSKTMTRIRELDKLLKVIVLTVVDTVKVSYAGIYLKDEEYKSYRLKHYFPKVEERGFPEVIPLDSPTIKSLQAQKRPLMQEEIGNTAGFSLDSGLIIPCFMEDELLGFLIMGAKPKHQMYTSDDILVFETLSYSTSLAIENCIFWKEIEDRHRKARLQEMDTYSYSLAHEIDNPMQIIIGQTELLRKYLLKEATVTEEKQQELSSSFDFILEAARRVSGMVKAIRDFGQKTTGELKPLNIEDVVESFARLYHPEFKDKIVLFEKTSSLQNPVFVRGEKPELMQALVILANNSLHAMTGLKEKKASLKLELVNHERVRVSFSDNGYGIKKENLEIIFTPFTTTKASTEGTGMGLYNAKKIIERHKGKIWAESDGSGKGATFVIELPVTKDVKPEESEDKNKGKRVF